MDPRWLTHTLLFVVWILSKPAQTNKDKIRLLELEYSTLEQRFELENRILTNELDKAKADIKDIKEALYRVLFVVEQFREEVNKKEKYFLQEKLKIRSLEMDVKSVFLEVEKSVEESDKRISDFMSRNNSCGCPEKVSILPARKLVFINSTDNTTERPDTLKKKVIKSSSHQKPTAVTEKTNTVNRTSSYRRLGRLQTVLRPKQVYLMVAKYGERNVCVVNVHNYTSLRCMTHMGNGVRALAVDTGRGKLYWSDDNRKLILSSDFDGSDVTVMAANVSTLGLAVDPNKHVLFYTMYTGVSGTLYLRNLTNPDQRPVNWADIGEAPRRLFLDVNKSLIYAITHKWKGIVKINYATKERELLVTQRGNIKTLFVDCVTHTLYFSDNVTIYTKDLKKRNSRPREIYHSTDRPSDIVLYDDYMYIVYYRLNKIDVIDLKIRTLTRTIYIPWEGRGNTVSMCLVQVQ